MPPLHQSIPEIDRQISRIREDLQDLRMEQAARGRASDIADALAGLNTLSANMSSRQPYPSSSTSVTEPGLTNFNSATGGESGSHSRLSRRALMTRERERAMADSGRGFTGRPLPESSSHPGEVMQPRSRTRNTERTAERMRQAFGSREEIESDDYQSPISAMFNRAYARSDEPEQQLRQLQARFHSANRPNFDIYSTREGTWRWGQIPLSDPSSLRASIANPLRAPERSLQEGPSRAMPSANTERDQVMGRTVSLEDTGRAENNQDNPTEAPTQYADRMVRSDNRLTTAEDGTATADQHRGILQAHELQIIEETRRNRIRHYQANPFLQNYEAERDEFHNRLFGEFNRLQAYESNLRNAINYGPPSIPPTLQHTETEPAVTFDTQERPAPLSEEALSISMACKVCMEQLVDTVLVPCGHAALCHWCADLAMPVKKNDHTVPAERSSCPVCRKAVRHRVSLYFLSCILGPTDGIVQHKIFLS